MVKDIKGKESNQQVVRVSLTLNVDGQGKFKTGILREIASFLLIGMLMSTGPNLVWASEPGQNTAADSVLSETYPERLPARSTWENIVSAPGLILNIPFRIVGGVTDLCFGVGWDVPYVVKLADLMVADDGSRGLVPTYSDRFGAGLKFYKKRFPFEKSKIDVSATVGLRLRQRYRFRIQNVDLAGGALSAGLQAYYVLLPDERFYGIGINSVKADKSNFSWEQSKAELTLGRAFDKSLELDAMLFVERNSIFNGKDKDSRSTYELFGKTLPGLESGLELYGAGFESRYNSQNHPGKPTNGWKVDLSGKFYWQIDGERFGFREGSLDITRFVHLFYGRTLVLRLAARTTDPFKDRDVPFYYLSEIGKLETLRGFSRSRFRDYDNLLGSLEYRYPLMPRNLDALLFVDFGQVSPDIFGQLETDDFETTFGGGIIIWNQESSILTFQVGKSRERLRVYLSLN